MNNYPYLNSLNDILPSPDFLIDRRIRPGLVKTTKQEVILKYVENDNVLDLRREINNLIICAHPCVVKCFGFYKAPFESESVLITPMVSKYSLDKVLNNETLTLLNKIIIIFGITKAMQKIESENLYHGNLNPAKILIDEFNHPFINDIGKTYSKEQIENEELQIMINYLAPEIISYQQYSIKADVYSFGLIINQLFTNEIPYNEFQSNNVIINQIQNHHLPNIYNQSNWKLKDIVDLCLNQEPGRRPSFDEIYKKLKKIIPKNLKQSVKKYLYEIESKINYPIKFFRIPKMIFDPENISNNNFNNSIIMQNLSNNFVNMLLKVDKDTPIILIMVFGLYQVGKSTFLRTASQNGAYKVGSGGHTTTKGILIDGPFYIHDLVENIPEEIRQYINRSDNNPAIFFIDSQGIGDHEENEIHYILKRIHSIFSSISAICLYVTKMNETENDFNKSLAIMQQMKMSNDDLCKIFFLVRINSTSEINKILEDQTRESYLSAQRKLKSAWHYTKIIERNFPQNSQILPLADNSDINNYNLTVWNAIVEILNNSISKSIVYIMESFQNNVNIFFSDNFDKLYQQFDNQNFPVEIQNCEILKRIKVLLSLVLTEIDDIYIKFKESKMNESDRIFRYHEILNMFCRFLSYILKEEPEISITDYEQYIYDYNTCIGRYLVKKEPNFKFALEHNEISNTAIVGGAVGSFGSAAGFSYSAYALHSALMTKTTITITLTTTKASTLAAAAAAATSEVGVASGVSASLAAAAAGTSEAGIAAGIGASVQAATTTGVTAVSTIQTVSSGLELTATISEVASASSSLAPLVPVFGVIAGVAIIGGCIWLAYSLNNKDNFKKIKEKNPNCSIPFLWQKIIRNNNLKKVLEVPNNGIIDLNQRIFKKESIIAIFENEEKDLDYYPMKFVIQCMTGINFPYEITEQSNSNTKEAILFGPLNTNDMIKRISRNDSKYKSNIKNKVYILYLRNCSIVGNNSRIISTISSLSISKPVGNVIPNFPIYNNIDSHLFCFHENIQLSPIYKSNFGQIRDQVKQQIDINDNQIEINYWPISMTKINKIGPRTNKTLEIALHHVLKRKKDD